MPVRAIVEPMLLRWGRDTAGLSVADAARRIQVDPERLETWEAGGSMPTIGQLRKIAAVYHRPLSVFFLPGPPPEQGLQLHDFRQLPGVVPGTLTPALNFQLRRARERRRTAIDLLKQMDEVPAQFALFADPGEDPEEVGERVRDSLQITLAAQATWRGAYEALNEWKDRIEAKGILVFQASRVELSEMRGLSIAEELLPIIIFNSKDTPNGRVFTMVHELCHLALRRSGICEPEENRRRAREDQLIEVFCNHVAGAALVPMRDLLADQVVRGHQAAQWSDNDLRELARRFSVSRFVILRRLLTAGRTTNEFYQLRHQEWLRAQEEPNDGGIVTPDRRAVSEGGKPFVRLVLQSYYRDHITLSDVAKYLGVRLKHLPKIERAVGY